MSERVLPEEFYKLLMDSFSEQFARFTMSVHATEEDFMREMLRFITSLHQVRRMLSMHDPRLKKEMAKIIEEDDYSDPELETRRATRDDLTDDFLEDVELDPRDFRVAETLVLLGQTSGRLPPVNPLDLVQKFSRSALAPVPTEQEGNSEEHDEVFVDRIIATINGQMKNREAVVKAVS